MLYIDSPANSLNRHYGSEGSVHRIVPDLRGCRVDKVYLEDGLTTLVVKPIGSIDVVLRPPVSDVEKWFAALYKWRSAAASGSARSRRSSTSTKVDAMEQLMQSTNSHASVTAPPPRRPLDIKIGSMLLLPSRKVKCILKDSGVFSVLAEAVHPLNQSDLASTWRGGSPLVQYPPLYSSTFCHSNYRFVSHLTSLFLCNPRQAP
jgi:hypothetical protein